MARDLSTKAKRKFLPRVLGICALVGAYMVADAVVLTAMTTPADAWGRGGGRGWGGRGWGGRGWGGGWRGGGWRGGGWGYRRGWGGYGWGPGWGWGGGGGCWWWNGWTWVWGC